MRQLVRFLKPYTGLIVLTIALLFLQANCDLALPDYLSKIVNIGIQQGGVENAVPEAIRQSQMAKVLLFIREEDRARVLSDYTLVQQGSPDYDKYVQEYPALENEPVYVLNEISRQEMEWLNPVMARGLLAVSAIEQIAEDPSKAAALKSSGFDLSRLPEGADIFAVLGDLPEELRQEIRDQINEQFSALGQSMIEQAAVSAVQAEYEALGMDMVKVQRDYILQAGGVMLLVTLISVACAVAVGYLSALTAAGVARDMRQSVFRQVESFSSTEFDRFSTASLITRTTNDITQIQMVILMMMRMVFYAPIIAVGGVIRIMNKETSMWWLIAIAVGILLGLVVTVFALSLPKFKKIQNLVDRLNLVMRENLSGMMVIRAFNTQPFEMRRFNLANDDLTRTNLFVSRVMATMFPTMMLIMNLLMVAIIWVGAHQVAEANMQVGDMIAFMQYAMQIVFAFLMMSFMFIILPRASVSSGRIAEVLVTEPVVRDPDAAKTFREAFQGTVEFRNVSFRYPGAEEDVLHDISFTAQPGQTTAFIGSTGSGKSTVVNLIPRFYDVTEGQILIDGIDIREVSQHNLRDKIGYIPQKSTLFSGTIESNLRYADEKASRETLDEAIEIAQAAEFVNTQPEGTTADISQGGANVSGGQKQRLSIARALVKRAPIYIFDDSFSALDFRTDAALRRALKERMQASDGRFSGNTLMIVTQRVSTIRNAEQIIVLDEGRVMGKGNHRELMETCETYREIALSQLSEEELA